MKEIALEVINHYGVLPQLKYFQSEVFELNEAIFQYEEQKRVREQCCNKIHCDKEREHIAEEIADVRFMLRQFQEFYEITDEKIDEVEIFKGKRQLERIEKEGKK